ncbi:VOC family protein [Luteimonas sp. SX5]|uniref:VOC family protein n=1 Tax=Luteimonas galliterrae TaxID=2940486 RepID=A0ABT0MLE3_9GAMM|nr:VOC family protein [Luteimonas galliterrae]MCL1635712.1 VOC family protein [Luteimonas galliterrae]
MVSVVNPYLNFDGNAREAFDHYRSIFGGEFATAMRFRDFPGHMGVGEADLDKIAHIALPLGKQMLMASDVSGGYGASFKVGTNTYIHVEADGADEANRIFDGLSAGGKTEMPLSKTEWAELYGICVDKFGVQWMVSYTGSVTFAG